MKLSDIQQRYEQNKPFVSVVTPTYNRRKFIPQLLKYYGYQDYPKDKLEFIILDDGTDPVKDLIDADTQGLNIRYIRLDKKTPLGQKRNILNDEAKGTYIVCMDDDDYYPPTRVSHAIKMMVFNNASLAGSSLLYVYFVRLNKIVACGPYIENHGTNGTFAFTKDYAINNRYEADREYAEEMIFTKKFTNKLVQLNSLSTIICVAHDSNTVNKDKCVNRHVTDDPSSMIPKDIINFYKEVLEDASGVVINDKNRVIEL